MNWIEFPKCEGVGLIIPPAFSGPSKDCEYCEGEGFFKGSTIRIGRLEIILKKRSQPIKEFQELGEAVDKLKEAILEAMTPILKPILDWLNRILTRRKTQR